MKTQRLKIFAKILIVTLLFTSCSKSDDTPEETLIFEIGQEHQGGIIFYLDETKEHGLIAYPTDLTEAPWGCLDTDPNPPNTDPPTAPIAQNDDIGFGLQNTLAIIDYCDEPNIAARLAYNLNGNGYNDWYLPSIEELRMIYENKELIGGFPDLGDENYIFVYASSSEGWATNDGNGGYYYLNYQVFDFSNNPVFGTNDILFTGKDNPAFVRPIRSF